MIKKGLGVFVGIIAVLVVLTGVFSAQSKGPSIGTVTVNGPTHITPGQKWTGTLTAGSTQPLKTPLQWIVSISGMPTIQTTSEGLSKLLELDLGTRTGDATVIFEAYTADGIYIGYNYFRLNISNKIIVDKAAFSHFPLSGGINIPYIFKAKFFPLDATPPFKTTWGACNQMPTTMSETGTESSKSFTWTAPGNKTVDFEVSNLFDNPSYTNPNAPRVSMMTNIVENHVPVTGVDLKGSPTGHTNTPNSFTASALGQGGSTPTTPTLFDWLATGQQQYQVTGNSATSTREYTWPNAGVYEISVQATNQTLMMAPPPAKRTIEITSGGNPPEILVDRIEFNFAARIQSILHTPPQSATVTNGGDGILDGSATPDQPWLAATPSSWTSNYASISLSVDPSGMAEGTYSGKVTISASGATPVDIFVNLRVNRNDNPPFGNFETPVEGNTLSSSVPVTGWVLDDIGIQDVKIYAAHRGAKVFVGEGCFVEGARPDVARTYPTYPNNTRAGWGYMLLTNCLPGGGNGTYTLYAYATDIAGQETILGTRTYEIDNAHAVKPFGAIDTPEQGGTASGTNYRNWGWLLTPLPNTIPKDGSTTSVWIDGVRIDRPTYNIYRSDIASLFPSYGNSQGAGGYLDFDATRYGRGVHTIAWSATDNGGNTDGIGSRYFSIQNASNSADLSAAAESRLALRGGGGATLKYLLREEKTIERAGRPTSPVTVATGYDLEAPARPIFADRDGRMTIVIPEDERIEIRWSGADEESLSRYTAYLLRDGVLDDTPVGSIMDREKGVFTWQPGPGFLGEYEIVLLRNEWSPVPERKTVLVRIVPQGSGTTLLEWETWWEKLKNSIRDKLAASSADGTGR